MGSTPLPQEEHFFLTLHKTVQEFLRLHYQQVWIGLFIVVVLLICIYNFQDKIAKLFEREYEPFDADKVQEFEKKRRETVAKMQEKTNLSSQLHKEQQEEKKLNKLESSLKTESNAPPKKQGYNPLNGDSSGTYRPSYSMRKRGGCSSCK